MAPDLRIRGALGGTRTPNLLIRRSGQVVQDRLLPVMCWVDVPQLSALDRPCPAAWQQYWQQTAGGCAEAHRIAGAGPSGPDRSMLDQLLRPVLLMALRNGDLQPCPSRTYRLIRRFLVRASALAQISPSPRRSSDWLSVQVRRTEESFIRVAPSVASHPLAIVSDRQDIFMGHSSSLAPIRGIATTLGRLSRFHHACRSAAVLIVFGRSYPTFCF